MLQREGESMSTEQMPFYDHVRELTRAVVASEVHDPVRRPEAAEALRARLGLSLGPAGSTTEEVVASLERILMATPSTGSRRFFNQLFGGRDEVATLAEMLTPVANTSMYTYKVAGAQILVEQEVIGRMLEKVGFAGGEGMFTPGGSMSNLAGMALARQRAVPDSREIGLGGRVLRGYVSAEGHYSVSKAAGILSIGRRNLRKIGTDEQGRMRPDLLRAAIEEDRGAGYVPFLVIATSGTTVRGAFDPIGEVGEVAREYGLWLHVDAAFGGAVLLSARHRHLMDGCAEGDSVTWDAHKLMGVPLTCSVVLVREPGQLASAFSESADYLFHGDEVSLDPGVWSLQCGRRNDALKLWAAWKRRGDAGYGRRVDHLMELAAHAVEIVEGDSELVLSCAAPYVNVCFEVMGKSSEAICEGLQREGLALVGHARVDGRTVIRVVFANEALTNEDVRTFFEDVKRVAAGLPQADNGVLVGSKGAGVGVDEG